ncbi:hypothetical protein [Methylobacterium nigriterrae]|uniref:hypothetical protein n=1 Tax=Methylobacterium nigriterrae TaxID=3127512 RepID=UPI003013867D
MAFFIGIAGPWIVLMLLDLFWTKRSLELSPAQPHQSSQRRLEHLIRRRDKVHRPVRQLSPLPRTARSEAELPSSNSYLYRRPAE